jgi:hypothetical protein
MYSTYEGRWCDGHIEHCGNYYVEVITPTLFESGSVRIFKHAHPDSLSRDRLIKACDYDHLEEIQWDLQRWGDPIETVYGDF